MQGIFNVPVSTLNKAEHLDVLASIRLSTLIYLEIARMHNYYHNIYYIFKTNILAICICPQTMLIGYTFVFYEKEN